MALFMSPASVVVLVCAGFPWLMFLISARVYDNCLRLLPEAEYYVLKLIWIITNIYTYCDRRVRVFAMNICDLISKKSNKNVLLIKDGNAHTKIAFDRLDEIEHSDYDMVLLEFKTDDSAIVNYKTHVIRTSLVEEVSDIFDLSSASFIGILIKVKDGDEVIKTETVNFGNKNYSVSGNVIFDRIFIKYLLAEGCDFTMNLNHRYEVSFFDNKITQHIIEEPEYVQLIKDGFNIIRPNISTKGGEDFNNKCDEITKNEATPAVGNIMYSYFGGETNWVDLLKPKNQ